MAGLFKNIQKREGKMGCRFANFSIIDAMAGAIKDGDWETVDNVVFLIEQEGEDADAFFAHINGHPEAGLIKQTVPQLFN